jgi:hypothetical protein
MFAESGDGIEPAFSAWEALRGQTCDLVKPKSHLVTAEIGCAVLGSIAPYWPLRVTRKGSNIASSTLWHGPDAQSLAMQAESVGGPDMYGVGGSASVGCTLPIG